MIKSLQYCHMFIRLYKANIVHISCQFIVGVQNMYACGINNNGVTSLGLVSKHVYSFHKHVNIVIWDPINNVNTLNAIWLKVWNIVICLLDYVTQTLSIFHVSLLLECKICMPAGINNNGVTSLGLVPKHVYSFHKHVDIAIGTQLTT